MELSFEDIKWYGRTQIEDGIKYFNWSAAGFELCMTGTKAEAVIVSDSSSWNAENKAVIGIYIKELTSPEEYKGISFWEGITDEPAKKKTLEQDENKITLFESNVEKTVIIKAVKLSELHYGTAGLKSLSVDGKQIPPVSASPAGQQQSSANETTTTSPLKIEFIGDSITCGYGVEGSLEIPFTTQTERCDKAYAWLTAKSLGAEFNLVSWSGIGIISHYIDPSINIPDNNWVMPALWPYTDKALSIRLSKEPVIWNENNFSPDVVVIYLGTNDQSYVRDIEERRVAFVGGYRQFLEAVHRRSPNAKILCCLGTMGQMLCKSVEEAAEKFSRVFPSVKIKTVTLPDHADSPDDGLGTDWHPSPVTQKKTALLVTEALRSLI